MTDARRLAAGTGVGDHPADACSTLARIVTAAPVRGPGPSPVGIRRG